jgi:hypothetical protein
VPAAAAVVLEEVTVTMGGVSKAMSFIILALVVGGGMFAMDKYKRSRPGGIPPVTRYHSSPSSGFGSRPQDFADPSRTTLRYVSEFERSQGVRPNTTIGGRR